MLGRALVISLLVLPVSFSLLLVTCPTSPAPPSCISSAPYTVEAFIFVGSLIASPVLLVAIFVNRRRQKGVMNLLPPLSFEPSLVGNTWGSKYVEWTADRLKGLGYSIQRDVEIPGLQFRADLLAFRRRWEFSAIGRLTRCVVLVHLTTIDPDALRHYSSKASDYGIQMARQNSNRDAMYALSCFVFPLVVCDSASLDVKDWVQRNVSERRWKAVDFRILVSGDDRRVYFCNKTPFWGAAYYSGLQKYALGIAGQQGF